MRPLPLITQSLPHSKRVMVVRRWDVEVGGQIHSVPFGFQSDGATIPRPLWPIIGSPFAPDSLDAAVLHDYLYRGLGNEHITREEADEIFRVMLLRGSVAPWRANAMWAGVHVFGGAHYNVPIKEFV